MCKYLHCVQNFAYICTIKMKQLKLNIMKNSNTITNRASEVNNNKVLFQVYGMDENGTNFLYETNEYDNYQEALDCFNSIELQEEGEEKFLLMIVVDEDDTILASNYLLEVGK